MCGSCPAKQSKHTRRARRGRGRARRAAAVVRGRHPADRVCRSGPLCVPRLPRALGWPSWLRTCSRSYTKGAGRLVWRLRAADPNLLLQDSGFQGPRAVLGPRPPWCMTGGRSRLVGALFVPISIQSRTRTDVPKCPLFPPCVLSPSAPKITLRFCTDTVSTCPRHAVTAQTR